MKNLYLLLFSMIAGLLFATAVYAGDPIFLITTGQDDFAFIGTITNDEGDFIEITPSQYIVIGEQKAPEDMTPINVKKDSISNLQIIDTSVGANIFMPVVIADGEYTSLSGGLYNITSLDQPTLEVVLTSESLPTNPFNPYDKDDRAECLVLTDFINSNGENAPYIFDEDTISRTVNGNEEVFITYADIMPKATEAPKETVSPEKTEEPIASVPPIEETVATEETAKNDNILLIGSILLIGIIGIIVIKQKKK